MGTTVNISSLLTKFKGARITSVADKRSLENHIAELEKAWKLGNTDDAKKHATNVQKIAKKYKDRFTVECIKTIESISSGKCVPPTPTSSARPVSAFSSRGKSGMAPTRRLANEKTPKTGERVTAATSKGSNANQSEGNGPNNEKETVVERKMEIQGIKAKAHQRQSEKNMEEQLRVIRDRMDELAATMRPQPKDVNISPPHIEDSMSLAETILSQSQEVLKLYKHEKDRINDAEKRLKDMFRKMTKQEYERDAKGDNRNEKPNKPMDLKELVGDIENRFEDYTRISDVEQRLKDMFRNVTKQEYASNAKKDKKKEKQSKSVDLMQFVGDIENRFEDYTRKMTDERIANEAIRMYEMCTGEKYKLSKQPTVDSIAQLLKQKLDSFSKMADEKVANEAIRMYEMCTGEKYRPSKEPTVDSIAQLLKQKLESLSQHGSQEKEQHDQLQKEKEDLRKRISDAEQRLKDMFRNVTKQEYASDAKKENRKEKQSKSADLMHLVGDIENRFEDYTRKMTDEKVANEAIRMYEMCTGEKYKLSKEPAVDSIAQLLKQRLESLSQDGRQEKEQHDQLQKEKEDLQKRISDAEQRLKDMFRNVTRQEYASDAKKNNRKEKQSKSLDLMQLVGDIENRFEDYTRKMTDKKVANEAIRMYEMCTGEKYNLSKEPTVDSIAQLLKQKLESLSQHGRQEKEQHDQLQKEKEDLQIRINDAMQRLKDMFRNVTKQENVAHEKRGAQKEKVSNHMDLQHLIDDIENWLLADYTRLSQQLRQKEMQYVDLYTQRDELLNRLSQHVSAKLTTNNPEIADLSDEHRPTKLGEMYAELYDNEWTDAYEVLNKTLDEKRTISLLLEVLTTSYTYCLQHSYNQEMLLEGLLMLPASTLSEIESFRTKSGFQEMERILKGRPTMGDIEQKMLMDLRKAMKSVSVKNIEQIGVEFVQKGLTKNDPSKLLRTYVEKCLHLCWFMCQQSPRMFIEVDIAKYSGAKFDKSTFREYLKFGKKVDYVVWLPLYLHKGGSLVRKGVADGK